MNNEHFGTTDLIKMKETPSSNQMNWGSSGEMQSPSDEHAMLVSCDEPPSNNREQQPNSERPSVLPIALEKQISLDSSDDTVEESDSGSEYGSEHSFSITPYPPNSDEINPTKNTVDQPSMVNEVEHVGRRLVTPCSSSNRLNGDAVLLNVQEEVESEKDTSTKSSSWTKTLYRVFVVVVALFCCYRYTVHNNAYRIESDRETIYVPGAGFSGFWYTLGRLQSVQEPETNDYYCFSAGCLGVVASLRNFTVEETLDIALNIQNRWKTGQIKRHDVVGEFVDTLVNQKSSTESNLLSIEDSHVLERIHVITSTKDGWFGMKTHIRSPRTSDELREMLLQTTWIPFAVGHSLWHTDSTTSSKHMDGAFTMPFHPKTQHFLGLPFSPEILLNVVNLNISVDKVKQFWKEGHARGV